MAQKQFSSIKLGYSRPVELYDGNWDDPEKSSILTADPNMLYDSWGSIATDFNNFSSYEVETISEQGSPDSTCSPSITPIEESSYVKEEKSQDKVKLNLKDAVDIPSDRGLVLDQSNTAPFELILDKSLSCVPGISKKHCSQLENCGFHTVGCRKINECRYCCLSSFNS